MSSSLIYKFTVDKYNCELIQEKNSPVKFHIKVIDQAMKLSVELISEFYLSGYKSDTVGLCKRDGNIKPVTAHKAGGLIHIGCMTITESEFKKLYNLIIYKQKNELLKQSGN